MQRDRIVRRHRTLALVLHDCRVVRPASPRATQALADQRDAKSLEVVRQFFTRVARSSRKTTQTSESAEWVCRFVS